MADSSPRRLLNLGVAALLGVLLTLAGGLLTEGLAAHGLSAVWFAEIGGERVEVTRTFEPRVTFPNQHRPFARMVQGWPTDRHDIPAELPDLDAELSAHLEVPRSQRLVAVSPNRVELAIDGEPIASGDVVEAGRHRLDVRWRARAPRSIRTPADRVALELRWGGASGPTVSRRALTPTAPVPWRGLGWLLSGLVGLLFGAVTARTGPRRPAALATAALVVLGVGYRLVDYSVMPEFRENADELFATWNGWSLLEDGTPRGWSLWPGAYGGALDTEVLRYFGQERVVVEPYFEHPPLLHVLVGAAAHLAGTEHWLEAKLAHTRLVPIALSAVTLLLLIALGRRLYPRSPAPWLGGLLYAALPMIVLQTRVIKEEALLAPLILGAMLLFLRWRERRRWADLVAAAVVVGLAPLTKVPAVVWVPALVMLVAAERDRQATRAAFVAAGVGLVVSTAFVVFGAAIDFDVWLLTQSKQGGRPTHWNLFPRWFHTTLINHNIVGRGWIQFLWLAYGATVLRGSWRDNAVLTVPVVTYLSAISIGAGNWTFGWYIAPLYPFLCLGAGVFLARLWEEPDLFRGFLFVALLVFYGLNFTLDDHEAKQGYSWGWIRRMVMLTSASFLTPFALVQVWRRNDGLVHLARATVAAGLALTVVLSGFFVLHYDTIYEEYRDFDRDAYYDR
jgi:4-amino-4-deoxy-L-arabinose transferase-like glycosyltransferase